MYELFYKILTCFYKIITHHIHSIISANLIDSKDAELTLRKVSKPVSNLSVMKYYLTLHKKHLINNFVVVLCVGICLFFLFPGPSGGQTSP